MVVNLKLLSNLQDHVDHSVYLYSLSVLIPFRNQYHFSGFLASSSKILGYKL